MNKVLVGIRLYVSSYFPLYIMLIIINFEYISKANFKEKEFIILTVFLAIVFFLSFYTIYELYTVKATENYMIKEINKNGDNIISYILTYVVQLISFDYSQTHNIILGIFLFVLVGFLYIKLKLFYLNPLFLLFGFYVYEINGSQFLITDINFKKLQNSKDINLKSIIIDEDIYLIRKKDNPYK